MQDIFVFKPYQFVPPVRSRFISKLNRFLKLHRLLVWKLEGVRGFEVRQQELLQQSLDDGHSIILAPNHSRTADPLALGFLGEALNLDMYAMASWHLFNSGAIMRWFIRSVGAFSVNREGMDRKAIDTAIELLAAAERPLVIFPEGSTSRTNDRLMPFLDGVSFVARAAAKKRDKIDGGKVVVHPLAFKYLYQDDIRHSALPILKEIEARLTWYPNRSQDLLQRLEDISIAQLTLKELEKIGSPQDGDFKERTQRLIDAYLIPVEEKWLGGPQTGNSSARIKNIRAKVVPQLIEEGENSPNLNAYMADIHDTYVAHQMACHPLPYMKANPTVDRVRETVERLEEDATDVATLHKPLKCLIEIGPAVEVSTKREKRAEGGDPLMNQISATLQSILDRLASESAPFQN